MEFGFNETLGSPAPMNITTDGMKFEQLNYFAYFRNIAAESSWYSLFVKSNGKKHLPEEKSSCVRESLIRCH